MATRFRAVWIPQIIAGIGLVSFVAGTAWFLVTGTVGPANGLMIDWSVRATVLGCVLAMLSAFTSKKAPIPRLARRRSLATLLAAGGLLLCVASFLAMINSGEYQALYFARALGLPLMAVGGVLLCSGVVLGGSLDKRWPVELDRERKRNIALARGAQPGDLMEAPPESGAGDLSEAETPGAVSIARAEKAKS